MLKKIQLIYIEIQENQCDEPIFKSSRDEIDLNTLERDPGIWIPMWQHLVNQRWNKTSNKNGIGIFSRFYDDLHCVRPCWRCWFRFDNRWILLYCKRGLILILFCSGTRDLIYIRTYGFHALTVVNVISNCLVLSCFVFIIMLWDKFLLLL